MDPLIRALNIYGCALNWLIEANKYNGSRRNWRIKRANHLVAVADKIRY